MSGGMRWLRVPAGLGEMLEAVDGGHADALRLISDRMGTGAAWQKRVHARFIEIEELLDELVDWQREAELDPLPSKIRVVVHPDGTREERTDFIRRVASCGMAEPRYPLCHPKVRT